jgi:hypothetical protein
MSDEPKTEALRRLYWREEILQVMFWIRGEGFGDSVSPSLLSRFLGVDADRGLQYLDRLVDDGYLTKAGLDYSLSDLGRAEGGRIFANEFAELTQPSHGECGATCWCHQSPDEAESCQAERLAAAGHDH